MPKIDLNPAERSAVALLIREHLRTTQNLLAPRPAMHLGIAKTVKQHLAAIRMLFDWLVIGQILPTNPAHAVRGPKHVVRRGKTPFQTEDQARRLLAGIDTSTVIGLRDRALIRMMTYTFARIGAVVGMRIEDYRCGAYRGHHARGHADESAGGRSWAFGQYDAEGSNAERHSPVLPAPARR